MNGGAVKRAASLAGSFPAVVFDPGHLSLVKGAPEGRRKFWTLPSAQLYPAYLTLYRRYVRPCSRKTRCFDVLPMVLSGLMPKSGPY